MGGDLLEVTLDEVHQLWQQLQLDAEYILVFKKSAGDDEPEKMEEVEEQVCVSVCLSVCVSVFVCVCVDGCCCVVFQSNVYRSMSI